MSNKNIGDYTIINKLGSGSFAQVYRAQHKNEKIFAMKVISREKIGSAKLQENLDSEISIMRDYKHENIVQLYEHFTSSRHIYLVLEYCPGGDLQKYIRKTKRLSENVTRRFFSQLAKGLKFLNSKNVIHRDIKPQNILLSENSDNAIVKYADFGFAKHLVEASMAQTPCGTPLYMAPEIFEMLEYNVQADIWSVGCVVFEMLVGVPPFKGANPRELFTNIKSRNIQIPPDVTISGELQQLILRLLEINPRNRISLDELVIEAERLYPSHPIQSINEESKVNINVNNTDNINNNKLNNDLIEPESNVNLPVNNTPSSQAPPILSSSQSNSPRNQDTQGVTSFQENDQNNNRPSGIAIGLNNATAGQMRRVRSREQINGGSTSSSPPTSSNTLQTNPNILSTSPASQRPPSLTSATSTMIMTLTNSGGSNQQSTQLGTSPSQGNNMIPGSMHRRTNSGERRYSTGDLSPVIKVLGTSSKDFMNEKYPGNPDIIRIKNQEMGYSSSPRSSGMIFAPTVDDNNLKRNSNNNKFNGNNINNANNSLSKKSTTTTVTTNNNNNNNNNKQENEEEKEIERGIWGTRWSTLLMIALWIFSVIISRINLGWTGVDCNLSTDDDEVIDICIVNSTIYRASSIIVFLFAVQALFSPFFIHIFDSYWILKIIYVVGGTAGLLIPYGANFFNDAAYEYVARIGAFIFIIFLQTIVLDFAYYWKTSWIDRSTVSGRMTSATLHGSDVLNVMNSIWHCLLLIVSILYLIIFVIAMAVLFTFFGGDGCAANNSILTITLVLMVVALIMQMFLTKNGSIIASGVLAAYVAYVAFSAVSINPDRTCNPTIGTSGFYGVGPQVIGLAISFFSIIWLSGMTSRRMAAIMGAGGIAQSGILNVATGTHSGVESTNAKDNLKKQLRVTVMNLNIVFLLVSFYIPMILTNWGTIVTSDSSHSDSPGTVSMWMQAVGAWIAIGFYMLGLIMPHFKILPDSIWDLQPKF